MKKLLSVVLVLVMATMLLSSIVSAASWPSTGTYSYCEFTANKSINVYRNTSLSTRGTSSPARSYNAYIDKGDVCRIYQITSNYIYLAYPTSSGYKYGYARRSDVFGVSSPSESFTSKGKATTYAYAGWSSYGYVASGDVVYKVGTSGNYTLVVYAAKSGNRAYKVGYVKTSDYNNIKPVEKKTSQNVNNRPTVRSGSTGSAVKTMQTMLNKVINAGLSVDGACGTKSVAAIKDFQKAAGLSVDGICGANTWTKLESYYNSGKVLNVSKAPNSIKIESGKYNPGTLNEGSSYSISGKIVSTYKLSKVTVGVYDSNGSATSYVKTVYPNATSYDIKNVDRYIKFGSLSGSSSGKTYYFKVTATDSNGRIFVLVNNCFKIKSRTEVSLTNSKYKTMAEKTFELQERKYCVLASYSMLVRCKLYCENKSFSGITQYKIKEYNKNNLSADWNHINSQINSRAGTNGKITCIGKPNNPKQYIINLLKTRPEGVVIHFWKNNDNQHAVRFCNYDAATDTFYVSDPAANSYKYTSVFNSLIGQRYGKSYDSMFSYINKIVYYQ